jgi:hypothetical protein
MSKLFAKLTLVQSQLKTVPENGRNTFHGYKYATAEDILNAVRPVCSEHGLFISISCSEHQILKDGKAASVIVTLSATDAETGESIFSTMPGYAEDPKSDKSLWKAITSASKYCIRNFFCIATSDDAEREDEPGHQERAPKPTAASAPTGSFKPQAQNSISDGVARNPVTINPPTVNRLQSTQGEPAPNPTTLSDGNRPTTLEETTRQMERVGWTTAKGRQFLEQNFGVSTRKHLTPAQLQQFLDCLRSLPPAPAPVPT